MAYTLLDRFSANTSNYTYAWLYQSGSITRSGNNVNVPLELFVYNYSQTGLGANNNRDFVLLQYTGTKTAPNGVTGIPVGSKLYSRTIKSGSTSWGSRRWVVGSGTGSSDEDGGSLSPTLGTGLKFTATFNVGSAAAWSKKCLFNITQTSGSTNSNIFTGMYTTSTGGRKGNNGLIQTFNLSAPAAYAPSPTSISVTSTDCTSNDYYQSTVSVSVKPSSGINYYNYGINYNQGAGIKWESGWTSSHTHTFSNVAGSTSVRTGFLVRTSSTNSTAGSNGDSVYVNVSKNAPPSVGTLSASGSTGNGFAWGTLTFSCSASDSSIKKGSSLTKTLQYSKAGGAWTNDGNYQVTFNDSHSGVKYSYRMAVSDGFSTVYSNTLSFTGDTQPTVKVTGAGGRVAAGSTITVKIVAGTSTNNFDHVNYTIYTTNKSGSTTSETKTSYDATTNVTIPTTTSNQGYKYYVNARTYDKLGRSSDVETSGTYTVNNIPTVPTLNQMGTKNDSSQYPSGDAYANDRYWYNTTTSISWSSSSDGDGDQITYVLQRQTTSSTWTTIYTGTSTLYSDTPGASMGTDVEYRVAAKDAYNTSAYSSIKTVWANQLPVMDGARIRITAVSYENGKYVDVADVTDEGSIPSTVRLTWNAGNSYSTPPSMLGYNLKVTFETGKSAVSKSLSGVTYNSSATSYECSAIVSLASWNVQVYENIKLDIYAVDRFSVLSTTSDKGYSSDGGFYEISDSVSVPIIYGTNFVTRTGESIVGEKIYAIQPDLTNTVSYKPLFFAKFTNNNKESEIYYRFMLYQGNTLVETISCWENETPSTTDVLFPNTPIETKPDDEPASTATSPKYRLFRFNTALQTGVTYRVTSIVMRSNIQEADNNTNTNNIKVVDNILGKVTTNSLKTGSLLVEDIVSANKQYAEYYADSYYVDGDTDTTLLTALNKIKSTSVDGENGVITAVNYNALCKNIFDMLLVLQTYIKNKVSGYGAIPYRLNPFLILLDDPDDFHIGEHTTDSIIEQEGTVDVSSDPSVYTGPYPDWTTKRGLWYALANI